MNSNSTPKVRFKGSWGRGSGVGWGGERNGLFDDVGGLVGTWEAEVESEEDVVWEVGLVESLGRLPLGAAGDVMLKVISRMVIG